MTERQTIERIKTLRKNFTISDIKTDEQKQEIIDRKKRWTTYFRNNPEIYIEKRMGFHSFGYQNFSYHLMQQANQYIEISTRGLGKSLRCIVFACFRALIYPGSKIGVTAANASQANENFLTAFMQEVVYKYSPFMKWLYDNKLITTRETDKGQTATFWNGSIIYFFPCINSSRGLHLDILIGEELRLIKKTDWDSIAMPMLVTRRAGFRSKPEYIDRIDLDEDTKVICISSNRFKTEWFNTMFNNTFVNYFKNMQTENRVLCCDIFLALRHGLKKKSWFLQQKKEMNDLDFRMEILNESIGSVDGAYFSLEMFQKNQIVQNAFRPPSTERFNSGWKSNKPKKDGEVRLIFVDFAFASTNANTCGDNDNTSIGCMSAFYKGGKWLRSVDYIETHSGGDNDNSLLRIRELRQDYEADYIVFDLRNGGELNHNELTKEFIHPYRSDDIWDKRGLTICNELELHMVSDGKLQDLRSRTVDPNAIPCLIPITATNEQNSNMWQDLKLRLRNEDIMFLIDSLEFKQKFEESKEFFKMTSEEKAEIQIPYIQTIFLINEAVNLTATWNNGLVKLSEPRSGKKDMIVSLSYGSYIMTKIINKKEKNEQNTEFDISEWQLVF